jgi:hypothetical protein
VDQKEAIEAHILATLNTMTIANGYVLPEDVQFIDRDIRMWDQTQGLYPALIIQAEEDTSELFEIATTVRSVLRLRIIIYLDPPAGDVPATLMNAYVAAIRRVLVQDRSRGGLNANTTIESVPTAALWKEDPDGQVTNILEGTVVAAVEYIHEDEAA